MTRSNERALLVAVKHNLQESCVRLLGDGVNVHCREDDCEGGKTPILIAAERGLDETLALLIAHDANVHDQCPVGMTVRVDMLQFRFLRLKEKLFRMIPLCKDHGASSHSKIKISFLHNHTVFSHYTMLPGRAMKP